MQFKNLALGTVLTAPSPATSGTSLVLNSGEGARFSDPATTGEFYATAFPAGENPHSGNSEIVKVTAKSTDTFTIVRAQRSTTAKSIAVDWIVIQGIYAEDVEASQLMGIERQAIMNGNFDVSQRATTFVAGANNDDVYTLDRWNLISDGNDVLDISQEAITDLPGSNYAIKLDVETSARAGIVQFIEAKDAQKFKGKTVSISFAVKSANIAAIRATVLSWSSTADVITSDVVGTWGATPTWATNWADNATPADLAVDSTWKTVTINNIAIDEATVNNLALVIWLPNAETIGDIIYISQVQMNVGSVALPFQPKSYAEELKSCERYYEVNKAITNNSPLLISVFGGGTTIAYGQIIFRTPKFKAPGLLSGGTIIISNGTTVSSLAANVMNLYSATINLNTAGGLSSTSVYYCYGTSASGAFIAFEAEL